MSVELVIWTFAYPPVHSTAPKKQRGVSMIPIELYNIVMTNTKVGVIPLGETWPMNIQGEVKPFHDLFTSRKMLSFS